MNGARTGTGGLAPVLIHPPPRASCRRRS